MNYNLVVSIDESTTICSLNPLRLLMDFLYSSIKVHMFLFNVIVVCAISCLLEMIYPKNVLPALCRVMFTILQGTWFYQIGFILYPPIGDKWSEDDHMQVRILKAKIN